MYWQNIEGYYIIYKNVLTKRVELMDFIESRRWWKAGKKVGLKFAYEQQRWYVVFDGMPTL